MKEKQNEYIVIIILQMNLENKYGSEFVSLNIEIIPSLVNNFKINSFSLIDKKHRQTNLAKSHSLQIYEHINSNF